MSAFSCRRCNTAPPASDLSGLCPSCVLVGILGEANRFDSQVNSLAKPYGDAASDTRFEPGDDLGPYRIVRLLGRGGMGEVYEALHADHGRRVALKVLARPIRRPADRERFLAEGQAAARISHPNSVFILEATEIAGLPIIAMELLPGDTLQDRVRRFGPLSSEQAVDAILQVIAGLEAAWHAGILHRDIKPGNCFIARDGTIKVGDYGLSVSPDHPAAELIAQGATPAFASPEQLRGERVDVRSDIYSLGATLWFLLTAAPPIDAPDIPALLTSTERGVKPLPDSVEAPDGLRLVLAQMLAPDSIDRPPTYTELREALMPFSSAVRARVRIRRGVPGLVLDSIIALPAAAMVLVAFMGDAKSPSSLQVVLVALLLVGFFWMRVNRVRSASRDELVARATRIHTFSAGVRDYASATAVIGAPVVFGATLALIPHWFPERDSTLPLTLLIVGLVATVSSGFMKRRASIVERNTTTARAGQTTQTSSHGADAPHDPAADEAYGPYVVRTHLGVTDTGELIDAWDPLLKRHVWIHRVPPHTPRLSAAARRSSGFSRLRLLGDHRSEDLAWDAFEAPDGSSLVWMEQASPWSHVLVWLTDLADELLARERAGEPRPLLAIDRVWISVSGRAVLLDFSVPLSTVVEKTSTPADTPAVFLHHVARHALKPTDVPLPVCVTVILQQLGTNQLTTADTATALRSLSHIPEAVTIQQRLLSEMMSAVVAGIAVFLTRRSWATIASVRAYVPPGIPEAVASEPGVLLPLAVGMALCVSAAAVVATTYRGGFWLHALGLTVVDKSGALVTRAQVLARALATWSWMPLHIIVTVRGGPVWLLPASVVLASLYSVRRPSQTLIDRLLGTHVVPR